jgi:iron(III) transport system substrate-binding protein
MKLAQWLLEAWIIRYKNDGMNGLNPNCLDGSFSQRSFPQIHQLTSGVFTVKKLLVASLLVWMGLIVFPAIAITGPQRDWQQTLVEARKEGKVVVSVPPNAELRKRMEGVFERRFPGIDLELISGRGSKNVRRIADEFKGGVRYFDVHIGGSLSLLTGLVRPRVVDPIEPYLLIPEVEDPKHWWGGHIYADKAKRFAYVFSAYLSQNIYRNTNLVGPEEILSYDDLLDPKWKGRIGLLDPRAPGPGDATWTYMWEVKGEDYLRKLVRQNLYITRNRRILGESLAKGKLAITIGLSYYLLAPFLKAGLPMQPLPIPKEGTYATGGTGNLGEPGIW